MDMKEKKCPNCGLWSPPAAMRCDCGYDFYSKLVEMSFSDSSTATVTKERAEQNFATMVARAAVLITAMAVCFGLGYANSVFRFEHGGALTSLAIAFIAPLAVVVSKMIKIKGKKRF